MPIPVSFYRDFNFIVAVFMISNSHFNRALFSKLDRIADKIKNDLLEPNRICFYFGWNIFINDKIKNQFLI